MHPKGFKGVLWSVIGDHEFFASTLGLPHWASHWPCWECDAEKLQNGLMLLDVGDALEKAKNMKKEAAEECTALVPFEPILEKRKLK